MTKKNQYKFYYNTFIFAESCSIDSTAIWVEGVNFKMKSKIQRFGIVGGAVNTNTGAILTKTNLKEILDNMTEKSVLKVCGCNCLYLTKEDLKYSNHETTFREELEEHNNK